MSSPIHAEARLVHHAKGTEPGAGEKLYRKYLKACITYGASDLHIKADGPPRVRLRGELKPLDTDPVTHDESHQIAKDILDEYQYQIFASHGQMDIAYDYDDSHRFRVNIFMSRGKVSYACRLITSEIKRFEELHVPDSLGEIALAANGLILFAGVTGSGKSTSIAAMLQHVNERRRCHIVTIEDPIEYIFTESKSTINQREVGIDCLNFNEALRALVREDPDVVLVGEMRDKETFEAAIRAAETGHVVFGTIHASSGPSSTKSCSKHCDPKQAHGSLHLKSSLERQQYRSTFWKVVRANCWISFARGKRKAWWTSQAHWSTSSRPNGSTIV